MSGILTPDDLVDRFPGTTRQTWAQKRYEGNSPKFFKVGRKVFYREADVEAWIESNLKSRTDETPTAA